VLHCNTFLAVDEQKCYAVSYFWRKTSKSVVLSFVFRARQAKIVCCRMLWALDEQKCCAVACFWR
jgi:hypothetical protein